MPHIPDLCECTELPTSAPHVVAVGWLSGGSEFPTGRTPDSTFRRLVEFAKKPWQPFAIAGIHACDLCQFEGEKSESANMYFPHAGKIYVAPELITHYINAHNYRPPDEFLAAVDACPPMHSMEYKHKLLSCMGQILWKNPFDANPDPH